MADPLDPNPGNLRKHVVSAKEANVKLRELVKLGESVNGIFTPDPEALSKGLITMDPKEEQRAPAEPISTLLESIRSLGAAAEVVALLQAKFASGELMTKAAHEAAVEKAVRDADQNRTWEEDELD